MSHLNIVHVISPPLPPNWGGGGGGGGGFWKREIKGGEMKFLSRSILWKAKTFPLTPSVGIIPPSL